MDIERIRAGGIDVGYRLEGPADAPTLMLAHGVLSSHCMWDGVVAALQGRWRVLRYDLRGHGASGASPAPYTMDQLAADAVALLDALALGPVHFVGTSLGGMIGQCLGARYPARLRSLVLANTTSTQQAAAAWQERIALARAQGIAPLIAPTLARWFTADFLVSGDARIALAQQAAGAVTPEGFAGCASAVRDLAQAHLLPSICVPTLVIVGEHDQATPASAGRAIQAAIPGAHLVALPAAHQAAIELPEAFAAEVERFAIIHTHQETT